MRKIVHKNQSIFAASLDAFTEYREKQGYSDQTTTKYLYRFDSYCQNNNIESDDLTQDLITNWLKSEMELGYDDMYGRGKALRLFGKYLQGMGKSAYILPTFLFRERRKSIPYILSDVELKAFFTAADELSPWHCGDRFAPYVAPVIFRLMYTSGLRPQEACMLAVEDVNLKNGEILIRINKRKSERIIVVSDDMLRLLNEYSTRRKNFFVRSIYFFPRIDGSAYESQQISKLCHACWRKANPGKKVQEIPHLRPYDFRHAFASSVLQKWLDEGKDLYTIRYGKNKSGSQRWLCKKCGTIITPKIDNSAKQLKIFLEWLFGKETQGEMPGGGRTFRRKTSQFWNIWPLPPVVEAKREVLFVDGIYLGRHACILICCDKEHVLGWYLCRYEHSNAWISLMSRIAEPDIVVSDGGTGFAKALKKAWPHTRHQRCVFHAFCQVKRYTTLQPQTPAGIELYAIAKELLHIETHDEAEKWIDSFVAWMGKFSRYLNQMTYDEYGNTRPTHERLIKAKNSLIRLLKEGTLFTYLDDSLREKIENIPSTNNQIEGGINSRLRTMLRNHRGLSIERRIKAVFWWCYMHSPKPLSATELLKIMPTDKSIATIYEKMLDAGKHDLSIPRWGDAVVWGELHTSSDYPSYWD